MKVEIVNLTTVIMTVMNCSVSARSAATELMTRLAADRTANAVKSVIIQNGTVRLTMSAGVDWSASGINTVGTDSVAGTAKSFKETET